jgi:hypothetical protein
MSSYALDRLLPSAEPGVQVFGVPGLRIAKVRGADLHLTLAGRGCGLVLRGRKGTCWRSELRQRRESERNREDAPALWSEASLTSYERDHIREFPNALDQDLAWLGSGLLRRVALLATASSAYSTRSWITGDEWIFELDTVRGVTLDHNAFLDKLMDPVWGLPLRIERHHCACHQHRYAEYMHQCTFHLEHTGEEPGIMQIRFRYVPEMYGATGSRELLERLGADPSWLNRVLPSSDVPDVRRFRRSAEHCFIEDEVCA